MTPHHWLDILIKPAANLPAADRLRLFRESRIAAAAVMAGLFPLLAFTSGEAPAVTAALLLSALLPAAVAINLRRPALLDRAAVCHVVIIAAVLTGGVLRGLPAASAIMLVCLAAVESFLAARRTGRQRAMLAAIAGILAVMLCAPPAAGATGPAGASLVMAALALCSTVVLARGLLLMYQREKTAGARDRMLSSEIESVVSEAVLAVDAAGRVLRVSANAERVLGLSRAALIGRGLTELTLVADRPALLTALADGMASAGRPALRIRLRASTDDAAPRYRWAEVAASPSAAGGLAIVSLRDVSAEVIEEERLHAAAAEAEAARTARESFLTTVNHELRTPLNAIIGFSEILTNPLTSPKDPARTREYARIINGAGQDLMRMVSAMIDITRIDAGLYGFEAEDADLAAAVEAAADVFRQESEAAGAALTVVTAGASPNVPLDARAFRSALQQVLSNAVKFGKGRGVTVTVSGGADGAVVCVKDRGDGIAADKLDLLGRHFARLDETLTRERGGAGLGLSLARGLMALHGGRISIESRPGVGTAVSLHLPARPATAAGPPYETADAAGNVHKLEPPRRAAAAVQTRGMRKRA